ncbi:MAG: hypothetical protein AB7V62_16515 [Thermoleophilia bacterium]
MSAARRRGGWLLAGGIIGVALTPGARRAGMGLRARVTRLGRAAGDPVAPFTEAPCYDHDRGRPAGAEQAEAAR